MPKANSKRRKERLVETDAACFSTLHRFLSFEGDFGKTVVTFILSLFLYIIAARFVCVWNILQKSPYGTFKPTILGVQNLLLNVTLLRQLTNCEVFIKFLRTKRVLLLCILKTDSSTPKNTPKLKVTWEMKSPFALTSTLNHAIFGTAH